MPLKEYRFDAEIKKSEIGKGGAYVQFPYDVKKEFGKGRVKVIATFDDESYQGSLVNMGLKDADGNICYIIGIKKDIREKIKKDIGDTVHVMLYEDPDARKKALKKRVEKEKKQKNRLYQMTFSTVYPLYLEKIIKKNREKKELDAVISWLTGYSNKDIERLIEEEVTFQTLFQNAPQLNSNADLITGVICGYRVEDISDELTQKIRYMDKLVDELAKGKALEKILRTDK